MSDAGDARADTIFALSSGTVPAGIAVIRVSGPSAGQALAALGGGVPEPRRAVLRRLRDPESDRTLDHALVLWFPGPATATGEDLAEFHLHGGRAVVAAVVDRLEAQPGLRVAEPGEFTRRAFETGRIDLSEAEGLADLLAAETEIQRVNALRMAEGGLSKLVSGWQVRVLEIAARVEALIDFSDEDDVGEGDPEGLRAACRTLADEIESARRTPPAERLRDGIRIVLGGPVNAGKSTLFNVLAGREAALVSDRPGTTRDVIEAPVAFAGLAFLLADTAGLRDDAGELVECMGIERAGVRIADADILLWLGDPADCPDAARAIIVHARADERPLSPPGVDISVSARTGEGVDALRSLIVSRATRLLPPPDRLALNARQRAALGDAGMALAEGAMEPDWLLVAEQLRVARAAFDRLTGRAGTEDMLDALFGRFCIGK